MTKVAEFKISLQVVEGFIGSVIDEPLHLMLTRLSPELTADTGASKFGAFAVGALLRFSSVLLWSASCWKIA